MYFAYENMNNAVCARPGSPKVAVMRPYKTFEGQTRYRKVYEGRAIKRSMKVIITT